MIPDHMISLTWQKLNKCPEEEPAKELQLLRMYNKFWQKLEEPLKLTELDIKNISRTSIL